MKFRVGKNSRCTKAGDTLVEVMFAVGIFSMVAITIVSVMTSGSSNMQTSLETTMARNEIDAQAEALRFIHEAYIAEKKEGTEGRYTEAWRTITDLADSNSGSVAQALKDGAGNITGKAVGLFKYNPTQCEAIYSQVDYNDMTGGGTRKMSPIAIQEAFVIDTHNISGSDPILKASNDTGGTQFIPASVYPRLYYTRSQGREDTSLMFNGNVLNTIEGIYIIGMRDNGTTTLTELDSSVTNSNIVKTTENKSAYYDFYIRSCWYGYGKSTPTTISTLIRLYDPDVVIEDNKTMDYVLTYNWGDYHYCTSGVSSNPVQCPEYRDQIPAKISDDPSDNTGATFTIDNKLADGYSFGFNEPLGWSTIPGATINNSNKNNGCGISSSMNDADILICKPGNTLTVDRNHPFTTLYAIFDKKYEVSYYGNDSLAKFPSGGYFGTQVDYQTVGHNSSSVQMKYVGADAPVRKNKTFLGWQCDDGDNCPDTAYHKDAYNIVFPAGVYSLKYKAIWQNTPPTEYTYTISYNLNAGGDSSVTPSAIANNVCKVTADSCSMVLSAGPLRSGYTFKGWSKNASANTVDYLAGATVVMRSTAPSMPLYAVWEASGFTFTSGTTGACISKQLILRWQYGNADAIMVATKKANPEDTVDQYRIIMSASGIVVYQNYTGNHDTPIIQTSGANASVKDTSTDRTWSFNCHAVGQDTICDDTTGQGTDWQNGTVWGERMTVPLCQGWTYKYHVRNTDNNASMFYGGIGLTYSYNIPGDAQTKWMTLSPKYSASYFPYKYYGESYSSSNVYWQPFNIYSGNTLSGFPLSQYSMEASCLWDDVDGPRRGCTDYRWQYWWKQIGGYSATRIY